MYVVCIIYSVQRMGNINYIESKSRIISDNANTLKVPKYQQVWGAFIIYVIMLNLILKKDIYINI